MNASDRPKRPTNPETMASLRLGTIQLAAASLLWGGGLQAHPGHAPTATDSDAPAFPELLESAREAGRPGPWIALGDALMQRSRDRQDHDFQAAEEAYQAALELAPDSAAARAGMAWVRNSQHRFEEGRDWARRTLEVDPDHVHALCLLSDRAVELGDYDAAMDHLQRALDAQVDLSTLSRAGHLVWLTGDTRKARWLMQRAIASGGPHPENRAWCRSKLAMIELRAGALLAAESQAELAVEEAPELPLALETLARVRACQQRLDEARELLQRATSAQPRHENLAARVEVELAADDDEAAARATERLLAFHGDTHPVGNAPLAKFLADHEREPQRALRLAEDAVAAFPNLRALDALAWCQLHANRPEAAARTMRRALACGTPDPELLLHAGLIAAANDDPAGARKLLNRALSLNPALHPRLAASAREQLETLARPPDPESIPSPPR